MIRRILGEGWATNSLLASSSLLARGGGAAVSMLFALVLGRFLGPAGVGVYFLAFTLMSIGATLSRVGMDKAVVRFASVSYAEGDISTFSAIFRKSLLIATLVGVTIAALLWVIYPYLGLVKDSSEAFREVIMWMLIALVPFSLLQLQGEFLVAARRPVFGLSTQTLIHTTMSLMLVLGLIALGMLDSQAAAISFLFSVSAACVVAFLVVRTNVELVRSGSFDARVMLRVGYPLLWVSGLNLLMEWTDTLVLGYFTDAAAVGKYIISVKLATLLSFLLVAVNSVAAPKFAAFYAENKIGELGSLARSYTRMLIIVAFPAAMLLAVFAGPVLSLFGPEFDGAKTALRILLAGQLASVVVGPVGNILIMSGRERSVRNNAIIAVSLNIVGNLILVPRLGITGAAISTASSLLIKNLLLYYYLRRNMGISTLTRGAAT